MDNTRLDNGRTAPLRASESAPPGDDLRPGSSASLGRSDPLHEVRVLGEYRILRRLGEGGMGAVYLGYDGTTRRTVALKVLNEALVSNQNYIDRFYREARSGGQLNHPNIVRTYSAGQDSATGKYYLVLEFVDGPSAQNLLSRHGRLAVADAVHLTLHIARALEHVHSRNIVHRDIKPDNILVTRSGVAKLGDLGLAKRTDELSHLTEARQGFGTTAYMPYEQAISARRADARSDIYALGATLYHLITGRVPFPGDNHLEIIEKKKQGIFAPAGFFEPAVPACMDRILAKMLAREPSDRYQTASELIIDLERTHLAAPVPSFADPDLARQDPSFQACQSSGEPTRLDPEVVPLPSPEVATPTGWIVRYKNQAGRSFTARLSAAQIARRLQEGTLPPTAEARLPDESIFAPVLDHDAIRLLIAAHAPPPIPSPVSAPRLAVEAGTVSSDAATPPAWQTFVTLFGGAAIVAALVLGLLRLLLSR
jgi:eukaryotic-like serine/threonine-protein kinase